MFFACCQPQCPGAVAADEHDVVVSSAVFADDIAASSLSLGFDRLCSVDARGGKQLSALVAADDKAPAVGVAFSEASTDVGGVSVVPSSSSDGRCSVEGADADSRGDENSSSSDSKVPEPSVDAHGEADVHPASRAGAAEPARSHAHVAEPLSPLAASDATAQHELSTADVAAVVSAASTTSRMEIVAVDSATSSVPEKPNFSGKWVMRGYEGNFEALMAQDGTPWAVRKLARAGQYGTGVVTQNIRHEGTDITVEFLAGPLASHKQTMSIGVGRQATVGEKGEGLHVSATWEGEVLVVNGIFQKTGGPFMRTLRYMKEDAMVVETFLANGSSVKRFYRK